MRQRHKYNFLKEKDDTNKCVLSRTDDLLWVIIITIDNDFKQSPAFRKVRLG